MAGRPTLVRLQVARARREHDNRLAGWRDLVNDRLRLGTFLGLFRQDHRDLVTRGADRLPQDEVLLDAIEPPRARPHPLVHEEEAHLPAVAGGETDAARRSGQESGQAALEAALEIDRHVEAPCTKLAAEHREAPGLSTGAAAFVLELAAREGDHLVDLGVPGKKGQRQLLDDPGDARFGIGLADQVQRGKRAQDIADSAQTDQEDAVPLRESTGEHDHQATDLINRARGKQSRPWRPAMADPGPRFDRAFGAVL